MSVKDCITSAVADGHINRDAGAEYIERYDELAEAIGGGSGKSWLEADDGVAERTTVGKMFDSFERDLEDFEALKVCVG